MRMSSSFLQLVSTVAWQCPDPGCATANSAGTEECSRCRLSFANAQEYLTNKGAYLNYKQGVPSIIDWVRLALV